ATGLTLPVQRGTKLHINSVDTKGPPPGSFKVGQLLPDAKSAPAPNAVRNMMLALQGAAGLKDIDAEPKQLYFHVEKVKEQFADYKFLYMHGRNKIDYEKDDLEALRFNLEKGHGLLFADACCGSKVFDKSFREFIKELFPNK